MKKHLTLLVFLAGPLLECLKVGRLPAPPIVATQGPWSESIFWNKVCPKIFSETKSGRKILKFTFPLRWSFPPWTITVRLASDHLAANGGACNKRIEHICFAHFATKGLRKKKFCRFCNKRIQHFGLHILKHKDWTYLFCIFCNKGIEHICFAHFAIWESSGDAALTVSNMREVWWNKRQWHLV